LRELAGDLILAVLPVFVLGGIQSAGERGVGAAPEETWAVLLGEFPQSKRVRETAHLPTQAIHGIGSVLSTIKDSESSFDACFLPSAVCQVTFKLWALSAAALNETIGRSDAATRTNGYKNMLAT
jgi:hypothetical protein